VTRQPYCLTSCSSADDCYSDSIALYCNAGMCSSTPPAGG
jgi:hypothetical protein